MAVKNPLYIQDVEPIEIELSDSSKLVITASHKKGEEVYIDIRLWVTNDDYEGPTKKGITFSKNILDEFVDTMDELNANLLKKGI